MTRKHECRRVTRSCQKRQSSSTSKKLTEKRINRDIFPRYDFPRASVDLKERKKKGKEKTSIEIDRHEKSSKRRRKSRKIGNQVLREWEEKVFRNETSPESGLIIIVLSIPGSVKFPIFQFAESELFKLLIN